MIKSLSKFIMLTTEKSMFAHLANSTPLLDDLVSIIEVYTRQPYRVWLTDENDDFTMYLDPVGYGGWFLLCSQYKTRHPGTNMVSGVGSYESDGHPVCVSHATDSCCTDNVIECCGRPVLCIQTSICTFHLCNCCWMVLHQSC
jgi:hypothetical protein